MNNYGRSSYDMLEEASKVGPDAGNDDNDTRHRSGQTYEANKPGVVIS